MCKEGNRFCQFSKEGTDMDVQSDIHVYCFTEVMATSMVAVTVPALAVPLRVGRGPGTPIVRFINQITIFFFV